MMSGSPEGSGWRRLRAATIWHSSPIDQFPKEFQYTPKVWTPLYYGLAIALGLTGWLIGSPILIRQFDPTLVDVSGIGLAVIGLTAFVGVAFPRLGLVELSGLIGIVFMLGCFASVIISTPPSDPRIPINLFIFIVILMAICMTLGRITILLASDAVWHPFGPKEG